MSGISSFSQAGRVAAAEFGPRGAGLSLVDLCITRPHAVTADTNTVQVRSVAELCEVRVTPGRVGTDSDSDRTTVLTGRHADPELTWTTSGRVGVPGWHSPEYPDPRDVLPELACHLDLLVRGEDGGHVAYVTLERHASWAMLTHIALRVAGLALSRALAPTRIDRLHLEGPPRDEAVLEVRPVGAGAVDVLLQSLGGCGLLRLLHLR